MKLQLPPRLNGDAPTVDTHGRPLIIIGANGSGKTRFARSMAAQLDGRAFLLSAMRAFTASESPARPGTVDAIYEESVKTPSLLKTDIVGEFDRMMALLIQEEMTNLLEYKGRALTDKSARLHTTRLDRLIGLWQEVFPDNRILLEGGRLLIAGQTGLDPYSPIRLSAGEKAVMHLIGSTLLAPEHAVIFADSPGMFLHPTVVRVLWDSLEQLRPDCTFVYTTHDLDFATSRDNSAIVWVRDYDPSTSQWDYDLLPPHEGIPEEIYLAIIGSRKPVLFIEGDGINSIDAKLYPLIFKEYTVKSLGSCSKVIEATRAFNNLNGFHNLDSYGIVDRDRRDEKEVAYLRSRKILVPEVAEIENILLLEEVVRTVAKVYGRDEHKAFEKVRRAIVKLFAKDLRSQALLHTRHQVKTTVEHRIDGRFSNINGLEEHMNDLLHAINPRGLYEQFCRQFSDYVHKADYASILRVYNRKSMLSESNVAFHCGLRTHDKISYIQAILAILRRDSANADRLRRAIKSCFGLTDKTDLQ